MKINSEFVAFQRVSHHIQKEILSAGAVLKYIPVVTGLEMALLLKVGTLQGENWREISLTTFIIVLNS